MNAHIQDKRLWLGGGAVVAVLIVLIGWFFVIDPELSNSASTRDAVESARTQNAVLEAKNSTLIAQNDKIAALRTDLTELVAALPTGDGLPALTRQLSEQAGSSVVLNSIIVGSAEPVPSAGAATGNAAGSDTATTTAAASTGLVRTTVTVVATGLGNDVLAFQQAIQLTGPRRALVTASQLAPLGDTGIAGPCNLTLTMTIFSAPLPPDAQAALDKLLSGN